MLFYSFEFLYLFLPIMLGGYYLLVNLGQPRIAIGFLAMGSLFFYGWWNYIYVGLIALSIIFNYFAGLALRTHKNRILLFISITSNLVLIGYFKYAGFFAAILNGIDGSHFNPGNIVLPLAISFFTFQQIAWLVDNYSGLIKGERNFTDYCLFVLFFPQLIAGPIVHHSEMMPQFADRKQRHFDVHNFSTGMVIFVIGLAKKIIVADNAAPIANNVFDSVANGIKIGFIDAWTGALAYTSQLYFDFSGYADMAIGLALMFNIRLPLNFNSPYKALSISDFWRRWHMTLSRFLRDYVYIPLGGNRKGKFRRYQNLMITMLIGGLWHGASWTFVFWGGLHGIYLVIEQAWKRFAPVKLPVFLNWMVTFISVVAAWVFFRADSFQSAGTIINAMASFDISTESIQGGIGTKVLFIVSTIAIAVFFPNSQSIMRKSFTPIDVYSETSSSQRNSVLARLNQLTMNWNVTWLVYATLITLVSMFFLLDAETVNEFIYFQF